MSFYRIIPTKDTFITNKIIKNVATVRATGSNFGANPLLRVFKLTGTLPSSAVELARTLIQFDVTELSGKIYNDRTIPSSSVSYFLKMFNYRHGEQTPTSYDLKVFPLSRSWNEGTGLDDAAFTDKGWANWLSASSTQTWTTSGSDFLISGYGSSSQSFDRGDEDLDVDVTPIVNNWLTSSIGQNGGLPNNGIVVMLSSANEENSTEYKTKIFHSRETRDVDRVPYLEARWNDVKTDNRNSFLFDQLNTLYMYNFVRGELSSAVEPLTVRVQDHLVGVSASYTSSFTAAQFPPGILSVSFRVSSTASFSSSLWYDIWQSGNFVHMTGTFSTRKVSGSQVDQYTELVVDMTNLKQVYKTSEEARIKVNVRKKATSHHVIHSASAEMNREYIEKMYFSVENDESGEVVVPFGTGSLEHTRLSYDGNGNYFNLWFNAFVPGRVYRVKFLIDINRNTKIIADESFIFKVV